MTIEACIPLPIQVVIDDVGWRSGRDGSADNEPYRTGIDRDHGPEDYLAIARLGRALGMRPQAAMILSEWDIHNRVRAVPTASWMGADWDNSHRVGPWLEESAEILRRHRDYVEITLHGIGHEHWQGGGRFTRAEWHDAGGQMRPRDEVLARLELYAQLLDDHGLGPMPRSFVPCAFLHHFAHPRQNLAEVLATFGITSISTPFGRTAEAGMFTSRQPEHDLFGFDHGVITVDRGEDLFPWHTIDPAPAAAPPGPVCGMHWPQLLHPDPARNPEVVDRWVAVLKPVDAEFGRTLAPDTDAFCTQLVHHAYTRVSVADGRVTLDARRVHDLPWAPPQNTPVLVKIRSDAPVSIHDSAGDVIATDTVRDNGAVVHSARVQIKAGTLELVVCDAPAGNGKIPGDRIR